MSMAIANPWTEDTSETITPPNVGDTITVLYKACNRSEFGYETDWETEVNLTVTEDMLNSWYTWGTEYESFEAMVLKVHDDEVHEAIEVQA